MSKFLSRKFLICAAAFLGSVGTSLVGLFQNCPACIIAGNICMMLSAGIYAAMEALVDAAAVDKNVEVIDEDEEVITDEN